MLNNSIGDRTVKDILEDLIGTKNAQNVLTKIQNEYDKGVSGEELRIFAMHTIEEIPDLQPNSVRLLVAAIAIIVI